MKTATSAKVALIGTTARTQTAKPDREPDSALTEFEQLYRGNADGVMAYFGRRCAEAQTVADLTSETFVRAASTFQSYDPAKGSPRAWLFGIAGHVFAGHCDQASQDRDTVARLAGRRPLDTDEIDELAGRIDAERTGRELIERCSQLPQLERAAVELVDLSGLTPKEAAATLGVSPVVLRKRLSRARGRLRKERQDNG